MSIINDKKQISKPTTNVIKSPLAEHLRKRYPAYMNGVDNLRQSGIGLQTMADNGIYVDKLGLAFPYRNLKGKLNGYKRWRLATPRLKMRYWQPDGSPARAYFPVNCLKKLKDGAIPIYITEGEKKALAMAQLGVTAIGLGGVWSFMEKRIEGEPRTLMPDLAGIDMEGREVHIVFDYDAKEETRKEVHRAKSQLATLLLDKGAIVFDVTIPPNDEEKLGIDDLLVSNDLIRNSFHQWLRENRELFDPRSDGRNDVGGIYSNFSNSSPPNAQNLVLDPKAKIGFVGEFLEKWCGRTEATDIGIIAHLLPLVGCYIGKDVVTEIQDNPPKLFAVLVGPTGQGRKGTACTCVRRLFAQFDKDFVRGQFLTGLSSGEGLIARFQSKDADRRGYLLAEEFGKVLSVKGRDGSILSPLIRELFDRDNAQVMTRSDPLEVHDVHICMTGHITPGELQSKMKGPEDFNNGFANRFLWLYSQSGVNIPHAKNLSPDEMEPLCKRLKAIFEFAKSIRTPVPLSLLAKAKWSKIYENLKRDKPGLVGALQTRGAPIVLRLALIYAMMDRSTNIADKHLDAALAIWNYHIQSISLCFSETSKQVSKIRDKIYSAISESSDGLPRTELHKLGGLDRKKIDEVIEELLAEKLIEENKIKTGMKGRPSVWYRIKTYRI